MSNCPDESSRNFIEDLYGFVKSWVESSTGMFWFPWPRVFFSSRGPIHPIDSHGTWQGTHLYCEQKDGTTQSLGPQPGPGRIWVVKSSAGSWCHLHHIYLYYEDYIIHMRILHMYNVYIYIYIYSHTYVLYKHTYARTCMYVVYMYI